MEIKTKFNIGDECYFLMCNKVNEAVVEQIQTSNSNLQSSIIYKIEENPAGTQYTKLFLEHELFKTKQDLLDSL